MDFKASVGAPDGAPIDWQQLKREILAKLDIRAEYAALGVRFAKGTPNGKGILPCHALGRDDRVPSAMVNVRSGVYHDSGTGESMGLFDAALKYGPGLGRWIDVLRYYGERANVPVPTPQYHSGGRIREAEYDYRAESGTILFRVFRYRLPNGGKSFSQHPPNGRGGWKFGAGAMDGVRLVPYRLPELHAAPADEPAWIVEGERDAERLAALGLVATCNPMGAGKWRPEFAEHFKGRICYVLPDNDPAGRNHAQAVCASLRDAAASVKLIELSGLPFKGDVSDWLDQGGTVEELGHLAYKAPEWTPPADDSADADPPPGRDDDLPPDEDVITVCLTDVLETTVEWLFPDRIPLGKLTLLAGQQKLGKSFLTIDLAARVSVGGAVPCGGGECVPRGSVVLLSAEDDLDDTIKPRLRLAGADTDRIHALTTIKLADGTFGPFNLTYVTHLERAVARLRDTKLVIIDPVTHYVGNRIDDNKVAQLRSLLGPLRDMASRRHIAVLVVTHFNKGPSSNALNRVLGSGGYTALARANWMVFKDPKDRRRRLLLSAGVNLTEDPSGLAYRIVGGRLEWEDATIDMDADEFLADLSSGGEDGPAPRSKAEKAAEWLATLFTFPGAEISSGEIFRRGLALGFAKGTLYEAKKLLGIRAFKTRESDGGWIWKHDPDAPDTFEKFETSKSSKPSNVRIHKEGDLDKDESVSDVVEDLEDVELREVSNFSKVLDGARPEVPPQVSEDPPPPSRAGNYPGGPNFDPSRQGFTYFPPGGLDEP